MKILKILPRQDYKGAQTCHTPWQVLRQRLMFAVSSSTQGGSFVEEPHHISLFQLMLPPGVWKCWPLRPLLRPPVNQAATQCLQGIFPDFQWRDNNELFFRATAKLFPMWSSWTARTLCRRPRTASSSCGTSTRPTAPGATDNCPNWYLMRIFSKVFHGTCERKELCRPCHRWGLRYLWIRKQRALCLL